MTFGLCAMWTFRWHWREHVLVYALFGAFTAVTAIYFGHTSYRAYLDLYWIAFAAGLLDEVLRKRFKYLRGSG